MIVLVFIGVFVFMPLLGPATASRKFKLAGLILLAMSPYILFEVFFPRRFNITARGDWIDYEFSSPVYAAEFALLNEAHVIQVQ
jgi:hypothetical protein